MTELVTLENGATVTIQRTKQQKNEKFLIDYHGGGFVYGSKNDLPQALADIFLAAGYTVLAVDYLLTPNVGLATALDSVYQTFALLQSTLIQGSPFSLCGRSAGGFAILSLTNHLFATQQVLPQEIIHFYGYYDLRFIQDKRSGAQAKITITPDMLEMIDVTQPVWDDPLLQRSLLYFYGLQEQKISEYYQLTDPEVFTIPADRLQHFPRTFSTASTTDQEVPFSYSKSLKRLIPESKFVPVYDLEHDFLSQTTNEQVQKVFNQLASWLKK